MVADIGKDCWNIIHQFKAQLEHREKFSKTIQKINDETAYQLHEGISMFFILNKWCEYKNEGEYLMCENSKITTEIHNPTNSILRY
ncbi:MAG: hypothetical protein V3S79_06140 [Candidatus Thermoplasmatota archaeon]